jgi:hypothetical protein
MTPQEQARYEGIFPNYATPEGFVGGKEAVELFSKSGVDTAALGKIWNMVDTPVDNKLDKLEFAMAMHLIVCISKKSLPLPVVLPISMKSLKSQQAPAPGAPQLAMPTMDDAPPALVAPASFMSSASSVGAGSFGGGGEPQQQFSTPPPLAPQGAGSLSISDAFEGLDGDSAAAGSGYGTGGPPPLPPQQQQNQYGYGGAAVAAATMTAVAVETIPEPQPEMSMPEPAMMMQPVEPPKTTQELASSYAMGDDSTELAKLKVTLQKLQAENIALKAQMGSMTQEEKDVQRETAATVAEIGKLSVELSDLRAQVLTSKSRLLETTAELAGAKEKKV